MKFVTDAFSLTGASHIPKGLGCQDYATSGILGSAAYAVLCDGSSCASAKTGEPDRTAKTGVGASALALVTARAITSQLGVSTYADAGAAEVIRLQQQIALPQARSVLSLTEKDTATTCMICVITPEGGFVHVQGDGVLAIRMRNGDLKLFKWDWSGNAPYYPSYVDGVLESFVHKKGGWDAEALTEQQWSLPAEEGADFIDEGERKLTVRQGVHGVYLPLTAGEIAEIESIVMFSDGIGSVAKTSLRPEFLDWKAMVKRMFVRWGAALPNFAMVRLDRWQQRDIGVLEAVHQDDLSISAIRIIHESGT